MHQARHCIAQLTLLWSTAHLVVTPTPVLAVYVACRAAGAKAGDCIQSIAWDPAGHRLAVTLAQPHPAAGTLALYSTTFDPVISCHLIGYVQPGTLDSTGDF
eukprot:GHRR01025671.1.p1 GENE.GHRR01025671.1~~GHRR01025671.1.p1  ORF type:complete len:102 (-),score=19.41 GHRR01025671.1:296-601(-)